MAENLSAQTSTLERARNGDSDAQYNLGTYFFDSEDESEIDYDQAFFWLSKAAGQNHAGAICNLGYLYLYGLGVEQDKIKAAELFTESATLGYSIAMYNLGMMYQKGDSIPKDFTKSMRYYREAALLGDGRSAYITGQYFYGGVGTEINQDSAFYFYKLSAMNGIGRAMYKLAICYFNGEGTQIDRHKALEWCLQSIYSPDNGYEDMATKFYFERQLERFRLTNDTIPPYEK